MAAGSKGLAKLEAGTKFEPRLDYIQNFGALLREIFQLTRDALPDGRYILRSVDSVSVMLRADARAYVMRVVSTGLVLEDGDGRRWCLSKDIDDAPWEKISHWRDHLVGSVVFIKKGEIVASQRPLEYWWQSPRFHTENAGLWRR